MTARLCSLLIALTFTSSNALAGNALDRLIDSDRRPTIHQVMDAMKADGLSPDHFDRVEAADSRITDIRLGAPAIIATLEKQFPGATFAFVGRDSAFLADIFEAYFLKHGLHDRVARIDISEGSLQNKESTLELLKQNGLSLDRQNRPTRPYIVIDATSWRGTLDHAESQARKLIESLYSLHSESERIFLFNRFNAVGQGTSSNSGEKRGGGYMNGKPLVGTKSVAEFNHSANGETVKTVHNNAKSIDLKMDVHQFFGSLSFGTAGPSEIFYIPEMFAYGKTAWNGEFGPLHRDANGKLITTPVSQSAREVKEKIVIAMAQTAHAIMNDGFSRDVGADPSNKEILEIVDDVEFKKFLEREEWSLDKLRNWYEDKLKTVPPSLHFTFAERWVEVLEHMYERNLFEIQYSNGRRTDFLKGAAHIYENGGSEMAWVVQRFTSFLVYEFGNLAHGLHKLQGTRLAKETNFIAAMRRLTDGEHAQFVHGRMGTNIGLLNNVEAPNTYDFYKRTLAFLDPRFADQLDRVMFPLNHMPSSSTGTTFVQNLLETINQSRPKRDEQQWKSWRGEMYYGELQKALIRPDMGKYTDVYEDAFRIVPDITAEAIASLPRLSERPKLLKILIAYLNSLPPGFRFERPRGIDRFSGYVYPSALQQLVYSQDGIGHQPALNEAFHARGLDFYHVKGPSKILQYPDLMRMSLETFRKTYSARDLNIVESVRENLQNQQGFEPFRTTIDEMIEHVRTTYDPAYLKPLTTAEIGDYIKHDGKILLVTSADRIKVGRLSRAKAYFSKKRIAAVDFSIRDATGDMFPITLFHDGTITTFGKSDFKSLIAMDPDSVPASAKPSHPAACAKAVGK